MQPNHPVKLFPGLVHLFLALFLALAPLLVGPVAAAQAASCAAATFSTAANFGVGTSPQAVAVGDFNRDGSPDLAAANSGSNTVSVLLGNGAGGFGAAANFGVGTSPQAVTVGDFNRDGSPDLAAANSSSNTVSVLLGNGAGGFGAATSFGVGTSPQAVAVGDFDRDGRPDLAAANSGSNTVSVLLGNGAGGFSPAANFGVGTSPQAVAVGDFNRDGSPDLAAANSGSNTVSVLLGNGAGGFGPAANFGVGTSPQAVAVGDFNRDGRLDLAAANSGSNTVSVLLGNGAGGFSAAANFGVGTSPQAVAVGDFDQDGSPDLAAANSSSGTVSVLLNDGTGGFGAAASFGVGTSPQALVVADLDQDGSPDLAAANSGSGTVSVLSNDCPVSEGDFNLAADFAVGKEPLSLVLADFNRDGWPDLATANEGSSNVSLVLSNGAGNFNAAVQFGVGTRPSLMAAGDFNRDGWLDLVTPNFSSRNVSVLLGNGTGGFSPAVNYQVGMGPYSVEVADFNRDGNPDLATADSGPDRVSVLLGNGTGGFSPASIYAVGADPIALAAGDFNRDGRPDLAVANYGFKDISVLLGNGAGGFNSPVNYEVEAQPAYIAVGDFNRDGSPDLAVANYGSNTLSVLLGNGAGGFSPAVNYPVETEPASVAVADFNRDGWPDLAVANFISNTVSVLLGNGAGEFNPAVNYPVITGPAFAAVADFDRDGSPDLATVNYFSNNASLLLNTDLPALDIEVRGNGVVIPDGKTLPAAGDHTGFDDVSLGGTISRTFTISNRGYADLTLTGLPAVTITGPAAGDFSVVAQPTSPIAGGGATTFQVQFTPTITGVRAATVTISSDDPDENPYDFAIQGSGLNQAPVADAGPDQSASTETTVALDGTGSSDPDGHTPLEYLWRQTGGSAVTLSNAGSPSPTFTAPNIPTVLTFTLHVTDTFGLADPTPDEVVVTIANQAPIADAGPDQSASTEAGVTLDGTGSSDPDGHTPLAYLWQQTGGPAVTLSDTGSPNPTFTAPNIPTALTFTLHVTDSFGLADPTPDEVVVTIANQAPVADAGPDQSASTEAGVTLDGTGSSDPDGHTPLEYLWQQTGGPAVTLSETGSPNPTFTAPGIPTALTFTLHVTDTFGLAGLTPDEMVVTVTDQSPIADAGPDQAVTVGETVTLDGTGSSDPDGHTPLEYLWRQTGGSAVTLSDTGSPNPTFTAPNIPTVLTFTLHVTDTFGLAGLTPDEVVVTITNQAPIADAGPDQSASTETTVTLDGTGSSDPDGHIPLEYLWRQTGGSAVTLSDTGSPNPTFTAPNIPTVLTFTLHVTDTFGLADLTPDEVVVTVNDVPITGLTAANSGPTWPGKPTVFTATIAGGSNVNYHWDFGNGQAAIGDTVTHTYNTAGSFMAIVTASNGAGRVTSTTQVEVTLNSIYLPLVTRG